MKSGNNVIKNMKSTKRSFDWRQLLNLPLNKRFFVHMQPYDEK